MMKISSLVQSYPLGSYFVLAYLISWGGSIAFGGSQFIRREPMEFEEAANMALIVLAGPFIAGMLSTFILEGKEGHRKYYLELYAQAAHDRSGGIA